MELLDFGVEVIAVSASGVLAPGPLFVTNILYGTKGGIRSGLKISHGHAAIEIGLIVVLAAGLSAAGILSDYSNWIAIVGGIAILGFAGLQIANTKIKEQKIKHGPVAAGVFLTVLNPFFLVWWATVGLKLISDSASFGSYGILLLFFMHVWMDYAWLAATAYLASKGKTIRSKYYRPLMIGLSAVLVYYGVNFLITGIK
ncbi:MAG: lysine transporter LysE [Nitrososphaera sp.]|nr:lysine transporter LysE [Nitrososphaera sp.]